MLVVTKIGKRLLYTLTTSLPTQIDLVFCLCLVLKKQGPLSVSQYEGQVAGQLRNVRGKAAALSGVTFTASEQQLTFTFPVHLAF